MNPANQVSANTVVMNNLLSAFDKNSYSIAFSNYFKLFNKVEKQYPNSIRLISNYNPIHLIGLFSSSIKINYALNKLERLVKNEKIEIVIGVFPTYKSLKLAYELSKRCNIKLIPYLMDLPYDSISFLYLKDKAKILENDILNNSVKGQLISDVPLGVFLSGGLDSSVLSAIASKYVGKNLNTSIVEGSATKDLKGSLRDTGTTSYEFASSFRSTCIFFLHYF